MMGHEDDFFYEGPESKQFSFGGYMVSATTTQLFPCSMEAVTDNGHKWTLLFSNKTLLKNKQPSGPDPWVLVCWPLI